MIKDTVRDCYIFDQVPTGVLAKITQIVKDVVAEPSEVIVHCGDVGTSMFILENGSVRLLGKGADEKPDSSQCEVLEIGDAFGEEIILGFTDVYSYEAIAILRTSLHMITEEQFVHTMWSVPLVVDVMRENAKHLLHDEGSKTKDKPSRGRASMVGGTSSVPAGFADAVFDFLEYISTSV